MAGHRPYERMRTYYDARALTKRKRMSEDEMDYLVEVMTALMGHARVGVAIGLEYRVLKPLINMLEGLERLIYKHYGIGLLVGT